MNYIIGISAFYYESSVCLIEDNVFKEFLKEESFTRIKGTNTFPKRSLQFLKEKYNLNDQNVKACVFYEKPFLSWTRITYFSLLKPIKRWKITSGQFKKIWNGGFLFSFYLKQIIHINNNKILYSPHHVSHALTSIIYDDFQDKKNDSKLIFVVDGVGDGETFSIFKMTNSSLKRIYLDTFPNSLGLFYSTVTDYLGFNINEDEYKVMGLSGYGKPIHKKFILDNIISFKNDNIELDMSWFDFDKNPERSYSQKFINHFGVIGSKQYLKNLNSKEFKKTANIASSFQHVLEYLLMEITKWAIKKTGIKNIYFSGGVAQNSLAMTKIAKISEISSFTVPPSPGDSGAAMGAAHFGYYVNNKKLLHSAPLFFTNNFDFPKTDNFLNLFNEISKSKQTYKKVAELISKGEIICVFEGGSETGPRSLGNRSILCSAKRNDVVNTLNNKIKGRESFRPLAPVILEKKINKYFHVNKKYEHNLMWMGLTVDAKQDTIKNYSSCVHVDGSSRLQVVKDKKLLLYKLLTETGKHGLDILINTSFNSSGEPIVFDYIDCYVSMVKMKINYLYNNNKLYTRI